MQSMRDGAMKMMDRALAALVIVAAVASGATAQQSKTMNGQPQQVIPQMVETGAPAPPNQVGSQVVTSGGANTTSAGSSGSGAVTGSTNSGGSTTGD